MDMIALPSGTAYVKFSVITHLFANATCPGTDSDGMRPGYTDVHDRIDRKLSRAVELGDLRAWDPLTLALHPYPVGDALRDAAILVDDLRRYAARHGLPAIAPTVGLREPRGEKGVCSEPSVRTC